MDLKCKCSAWQLKQDDISVTIQLSLQDFLELELELAINETFMTASSLAPPVVSPECASIALFPSFVILLLGDFSLERVSCIVGAKMAFSWFISVMAEPH